MEEELNYETVTFNTNGVATYGESWIPKFGGHP